MHFICLERPFGAGAKNEEHGRNAGEVLESHSQSRKKRMNGICQFAELLKVPQGFTQMSGACSFLLRVRSVGFFRVEDKRLGRALLELVDGLRDLMVHEKQESQ